MYELSHALNLLAATFLLGEFTGNVLNVVEALTPYRNNPTCKPGFCAVFSWNSTEPTRTSSRTSTRGSSRGCRRVRRLPRSACRRNNFVFPRAGRARRSSPTCPPTRALFLVRMSVRDARVYTCTVHDKLSCARLQNYTIGASLMSVSVSVPLIPSLRDIKYIESIVFTNSHAQLQQVFTPACISGSDAEWACDLYRLTLMANLQ